MTYLPTSPAKPFRSKDREIRRLCSIGLWACIVLVFGTGAWAAITQLPGAVIAPGQVVVESSLKRIQHPTGGVIAELFVREGAHVGQGDLILKLDQTALRATVVTVRKQLDELGVRLARLEAERDGKTSVVYPQDILARSASPDVNNTIQSENNLFEARRAALSGTISQLRERAEQARSEVRSLESQREALLRQKEIVARELDGIRPLAKKNLVPLSRLTQLEREEAQNLGSIGKVGADTAQAQAKTLEAELQIKQSTQDFKRDVNTDIRTVQASIGEAREKLVSAQDALDKTEIRSPQTGAILNLSATTVGGVITAGADIAFVVPENDMLVIDGKVASTDIDNVRFGTGVTLRFPAFNHATTPEIEGELVRIAADALQDTQTKAYLYPIRVSIPKEQLQRLGGKKLVPGMPVEIMIRMAPRTVMSYFLKPFRDQLARAFRQS